MSHTVDLVCWVVNDLKSSGFHVAVFGGWAEELLELAGPREHGDIDLLVFDADPDDLGRFVEERGEILEKRSSQKRAFLVSDLVVELFLVRGGRTVFWDTLEYVWPLTGCVEVDGLPVASAEYLSAYRRDYAAIRAAGKG